MRFPSKSETNKARIDSGVKDIQFVEKIGNYISNSGEFDPGSG